MPIVAPRAGLCLLALASVALVGCVAIRRATAPSTPVVTRLPPVPVPPPPPPAPPVAAADDRTELQRLVDELTGADFGGVYHAYLAFQRDPDPAIPELVALLDREDRVPLTNTADLIYPGATEFYGHGWMVPYDLDWISVRAGWVLEELAFQDFGFSRDQRGRNPAAEKRARAWWRAGKITRREAILAALDSRDAGRRDEALRYLSNLCNEAPIPGLDGASSRRALEPRLRRLARRGTADEREAARDALAHPPWRDVCDE